ncbi:hypothetical protein HW532_18400 [Kaustia mangrovi]|uniref:Uncharacterized protein n=1 Tax=Kaustia mangrovi TaxID=2593653 RepID=A0A7S8C6U7_9HYPH|nr:hypothetical protein [Kaustia mangrovi]QPC44493.1 hypothetical protein HW532_18400 [Kaustia mangrovi]
MAQFQSLTNWSPKRAHSFSMRRVEKIKHLLTEIGGCYGDVDECVVSECDRLIDGAFEELEAHLADALAEGRSL